MKRRGVIAALAVLMAVFPAIAGDANDSVKRAIRASGAMNDSWLSTCLQVAKDQPGISLCKTVHGLYDKAIKDSLR